MEENNKEKKSEKNDFYANFISKLQHHKSMKLRTSFVNFIKDIQKDRRDILDMITTVNDFRETLEVEFQELWKEDEDKEEQNGEAIEGLLTKNLYDKLIGLYPLHKDKSLAKKFFLYSFIEPKHLEIPDEIILESTLQHAIEQINKIVKYKTPRDKVIAIINACKIISTMVAHAQKNLNKLTGADDFLPTLIYTVIKAKPINSACDLSYIRDLRSSRRLRGMEEYYFTAFESAIHFVENLNHSQLKIDKEEFENLIALNEELYEKENAELNAKAPETKKEEFEILQVGNDNKENCSSQHDNLKVIAEDMAETIHENYKDLMKKIQELKEFTDFDIKSKKYYNKNPRELYIGEIDNLVVEYNAMCNLHRDVCKKIGEINQLVDEKINPGKRQEKSVFTFFKFK